MVYEVVDNAIDEALAGPRHAGRGHPQRRRLLHRHRRWPRHSHRHPRRRGGLRRRSHHDPAPRRRVSSTRIPTRFPAGCTASACRSSTPCPTGWSSRSTAAARPTRCASSAATPSAPLKVTGDSPKRENGAFLTGTEVTFLPSLRTSPNEGTFLAIDFDFKTLEHRLRELAFLNSGVVIYFRDLRGAEPIEEILHYEGGVEAFVRHLDKAKTPCSRLPDHPRQEGHRRDRPLAVVERRLPRDHAVLHQQHPAAGRRDAPIGVSRRADAGHHRLCRKLRRRQAGEGHRHRRGRPRGPDLRPVGQGARPQVQFADEGQAGLLRGPARPSKAWSARASPSGSRNTPTRPSW